MFRILTTTAILIATLINQGIADHSSSSERFQVYTAYFGNYTDLQEGHAGLRPRIKGPQSSSVEVPPEEGDVGMYAELVRGPVLTLRLKGSMSASRKTVLPPTTYEFTVQMTLRGQGNTPAVTIATEFQHKLTQQYFVMNPTLTVYWPVKWEELNNYADDYGQIIIDFNVAIRNPGETDREPLPLPGESWPVKSDGTLNHMDDDNDHDHDNEHEHDQDHSDEESGSSGSGSSGSGSGFV